MLVATVGSKNPSFFQVFAARNPGGRPKGAHPRSQRTLKPWLAEGVSERTYRRRKAVIAAQVPHDAHVAVWHALTVFERMDLRAAARRHELAAARRRPFGEEIEIALRKRAH